MPPINSRLSYLDALCNEVVYMPSKFPDEAETTGQFSDGHPLRLAAIRYIITTHLRTPISDDCMTVSF